MIVLFNKATQCTHPFTLIMFIFNKVQIFNSHFHIFPLRKFVSLSAVTRARKEGLTD